MRNDSRYILQESTKSGDYILSFIWNIRGIFRKEEALNIISFRDWRVITVIP